MSVQEIPTFSRESADYTAKYHAMQRIKDPERPSAEMVNEAIEQGEPVDATRNDGDLCVVVEHEWAGSLYTVILKVQSCEVLTTHYGKDKNV